MYVRSCNSATKLRDDFLLNGFIIIIIIIIFSARKSSLKDVLIRVHAAIPAELSMSSTLIFKTQKKQ